MARTQSCQRIASVDHRRSGRLLATGALLLSLLAACAGAPATVPSRASVDTLAEAMSRQPIVVLGEVHDNVAQHALRAQALRRLVDGGKRPAIALEQFDRDQQEALDRVRNEPGGDIASRVSRLIAAAGGRGWKWDLYRPYLALALEEQLPIVAANLSRTQAMRVAQDGIGAVFDASQRAALGLDAIPQDMERAQEREIDEGHCGRLAHEALPAMAEAQIARDATLAQAITPYFDRGVVLLTGNGHARRDIGVLRHLSARDRARAISIGMLEDDEKAAAQAVHFDVALLTPVQSRPDPCAEIPQMRMGAVPATPAGSRVP